MNYSPFFYQMPSSIMPMASTAAKSGGLLSSLFGGMNFGSIVTNAGKTLGVINQAIPIVKQAGPVVKNARTMFKVLNEFKKPDTNSMNSNNNIATKNINTNNNNNSNNSTKVTDTNINNEETTYNSEIKFDGSPVFFV